jgi:hypothetical protein
VQCIKRLQTLVGDLEIFIHCLTILASLQSEHDDMMLDLYIYYANIGLGLPSPKLRAGAVAMLASLLPAAESLVISMLPQMLRLARTERWWEMHAHLLSFAGKLVCSLGGARGESKLQHDPVEDAEQALNETLEIVNEIFSTRASKNIRICGLVALAEATQAEDRIIGPYLQVLYSLEDNDRKFLLGFLDAAGAGRPPRFQASAAGISPLPSSIGIPFAIRPVTGGWNPLGVTGYIAETANDRLTAAQFQALHAAVLTAESRSSEDALPEHTLAGPWLDMFANLKDKIFAGLTDSATAVSAVGVLSSFLFGSTLRDTLLEESKFVSSLKQIYPSTTMNEGQEQLLRPCQAVLEAFMRDAFSAGAPFDRIANTTIAQFAKINTNNFEKSTGLQKLLKEFSSKLR